MSSSKAPPPDARASLDQTFSLLKSKDDTSRFAGLSLLRSVLDANEQLRNDEDTVSQCWDAISPIFLTRLLKARVSEKTSSEEASSMITLAVSVIHAFTTMLPEHKLAADSITTLCSPLINIISVVDAETKVLALQALAKISSQAQGAIAILDAENLEVLIEASVSEELAIDILRLMLILSVDRFVDPDRKITDTQRLKEWDNAVSNLITVFTSKDGTPALELIADVLEATQLRHNPIWLPKSLELVKYSFIKLPVRRTRSACTRLIHYFVQYLGLVHCLFPEKASFQESNSSKPFSYIFATYLLIDIRSTIPSLMELLASADYTNTSLRLAADFDIISAFLASLITLPSPEEAQEISFLEHQPVLDVPPDLILQLRKALSETVSLAIEHLRDRWDAAITGAAGLDPSARPSADKRPATDTTEKFALTWENPTIPLMSDPIILASTRVISQWLLDDDNEQLRTEAAGIMDILLHLYTGDDDTRKDNSDIQLGITPDYRPYVLSALEGILNSDAGVQAFLENGGWPILGNDLLVSFKEGHWRTMGIIRSLLLVIESVVVTQTKEAWLQPILTLINEESSLGDQVKSSISVDEPKVNFYEAYASIGQLAVAMVSKAPRKHRIVHKSEFELLRKSAKRVIEHPPSGVTQDTKDSLMEVFIGIEELEF